MAWRHFGSRPGLSKRVVTGVGNTVTEIHKALLFNDKSAMAFMLGLLAFYLLGSIVLANTPFNQAPIFTPKGKLYASLLGEANLVQSAIGNTPHAAALPNTPVALSLAARGPLSLSAQARLLTVFAALQDIYLAQNARAEASVSLHVIQNAISTTRAPIICTVVGQATTC